MSKDASMQLVSILADGKFHSGTELGEMLCVSRAAVWKHIKKLEASGLLLESVKGKGYRVFEGRKLIQPERVLAFLSPPVQSCIKQINYTLSTGSTNADAFAAIQQGEQRGLLVVTESQTAGRGRRGRSWVSPFASNLYFSLVWSFEGGAAALEGLSLVVGVAVAKALESLGVQGIQLKWPNDVWLEGKKLAGVLLEMSGDASGFCQVVIGVGVNVAMSEAEGESVDQAWASLQEYNEINRNQLLICLLEQLVSDLSVFSVEGFSAYKGQWLHYDACNGREVSLNGLQQVTQGIARGVDDSGALLLEVGERLVVVNAGEVSLRMEA